ncbi:MAG TPA: hypothetical protein VFA89_07990 [Terriglobales bacterium]|nr:hypothetical protein [Terriglobales bacterium]
MRIPRIAACIWVSVVVTILAIPQLFAQTLTTTAGGFVGDGRQAAKASFNTPFFIAQDSAGNTYLSDFETHRVRKITPTGVISTFAGTGISGYSGDGGPANAAMLSYPTALAFDSAGNLVIADGGNNRIRKVSKTGVITTFAGTGAKGYSGDGGPALQATFNQPYGLTYDAKGNLYISDIGNSVVRVINTSSIITTYAGDGIYGYSGDGGPAILASLSFPRGLASDSAGNLYIADTDNHVVRKVNAAGTITTYAGNGSNGYSGDGGPATSAAIGRPRGLLVRTGSLFITNGGHSRVRTVSLSTQIISTFAGSSYGYDGDGNPLLSSQFAGGSGMIFTKSGNFEMADNGNARLRMASGGLMRTVAGGYIGDGGAATTANLVLPEALAFDKNGNYYVAEYNGNRIRKVTSTGAISTFAGTGISGYTGDGGAATAARLDLPFGVAVDSSGNVFIADDGNAVIREVDSSGNISTFATDPNFIALGPMAIDGANNLFVTDSGSCVIWKISPAGSVSVAAGVLLACGYNGDNVPATSAELNQPFGVAVDSKGNLFIADSNNNRVRRVNTSGIITTFAGNGTCGFSGDGGLATSAELCFPEGVALTSTGAVYIADSFNFRIRSVSRGTINTFAGTGTSGYNGNRLAALSTNLDDPVAVTVNAQGVLYMIDDAQALVRRIH